MDADCKMNTKFLCNICKQLVNACSPPSIKQIVTAAVDIKIHLTESATFDLTDDTKKPCIFDINTKLMEDLIRHKAYLLLKKLEVPMHYHAENRVFTQFHIRT